LCTTVGDIAILPEHN